MILYILLIFFLCSPSSASQLILSQDDVDVINCYSNIQPHNTKNIIETENGEKRFSEKEIEKFIYGCEVSSHHCNKSQTSRHAFASSWIMQSALMQYGDQEFKKKIFEEDQEDWVPHDRPEVRKYYQKASKLLQGGDTVAADNQPLRWFIGYAFINEAEDLRCSGDPTKALHDYEKAILFWPETKPYVRDILYTRFLYFTDRPKMRTKSLFDRSHENVKPYTKNNKTKKIKKNKY